MECIGNPSCFFKAIYTKLNIGLVALCVIALSACSSTPQLSVLDQAHASSEKKSACPSEELNESHAIVRVATGMGSDGSGVVIGENLVLTAAHVLEDGGLALVRIDDAYREANIMAVDLTMDLAILSVETLGIKPVNVSLPGLQTDERVWAIGYPLALNKKVTTGLMTEFDGERLFTSAPIQAGTSGGGLFHCQDGQYQLAGMVRGYAAIWTTKGELIERPDISISVPADMIRSFASTAGVLL